MSKFQTEIKAENGQNIYAIGDIHGDIRALIICLRDCCRVIRKKSGIEFNQKEIDKNMIDLLNLDTVDPPYIHDLNYEWCGGNSIIVFTGDLIHGNRYNIPRIEFPHEELKIFLLINSIHEQAIKQNGKLIKLLGNHEFVEIFSNYLIYAQYVTANANNKDLKYINNGKSEVIDRKSLFQIGNNGCDALSKNGIGILVKVNDFIFTHAGITTKENKIYRLRKNFTCLNNYINKVFLSKSIDITNKIAILQVVDVLDNREIITDRGLSGRPKTPEEENTTQKCIKLNKYFKEFYDVEPSDDYKYLKLVVGHTPQFNGNDEIYYLHGSESPEKILDNKKHGITIFKKPFSPKRGLITTTLNFDTDIDDIANYKHTISMDCLVNDNPQLFVIDVGMSVAFDNFIPSKYILSIIKSRLPQVLHIKYKDILTHDFELEVIRSTLRNTLIHQTRILSKETELIVNKFLRNSKY